MSLKIPAEKLIPHRFPMRLISNLALLDSEQIRVEACLPAESIVADAGGVVVPLALVELIAQAYAAARGYELSMAGCPPSRGYLVGIQRLEILAAAHCNEQLMISIETVGEFEGFAVVDGLVSNETDLLARARIKLFLAPMDA